MNKISLQGVEDTLFIPLMARAYVSKRFPEYFYDEKVLEIEQQLPSNFITEKSSEYTMMGSASRAVMMDDLTKAFIEKYIMSNIVCVGCGFETMAWRLGNYQDKAHFYEIDFDTVIENRGKILGTYTNETLISGDINTLNLEDYMDCSLPTLFVVAGVFEYFKEQDVLNLIKKLQGEFQQAEMIFDAVNDFGLKYVNRYVQKTGNINAMMYFSVNDGAEFAALSHTKLIKQHKIYAKVTKTLKKKLKVYTKISMFVNDYQDNSMILELEL